ncbi:MAG: PilC/PilY family type IV pilus protein [Myxococcaceae bacterium]|nr:PilC/PilY family type IV pilus protein [Myxococcaceae bacterium]
MTVTRTLLAAVLLSALVVNAEPAKPRVMVILDSSRSMLEPTNTDWPPTDMSAPGGDWDRNTNPACANKFCTAKKVIDTVIPDFTGEARIGLATYYQFLLRADKPSTETSSCTYDVVSAPGRRRVFSSEVDLTGSGMTICGPATCDASGNCTPADCTNGARAINFPDGNGAGTGANLDTVCKTAATYTRPALPNTTVPTCSGDRCYSLTKIAANPSSNLDCNIYRNPATPVPVTLSGFPSCTNGNYTTLVTQSVIDTVNQYVALGTPSCGAAGTSAPVVNPAVAPAQTLAGNPNLGTGVGQWFGAGASALRCTGSVGCSLFLKNSAPTTSANTPRHWFGAFNDTFTPTATITSMNATPANSYQFQSRTASSSYVANFFRDAVGVATPPTITQSTACLPSGRYSSGQTLSGTFGVDNPEGQLQAASSPLRTTGSTNESPGRSGSDIACTGDFPCDVTLQSQTPNVTMTAGPTIFNTGALPAGHTLGAMSTQSWTARMLNGNTCSDFTSSASSPGVPNGVWTSGPPSSCATYGSCQFNVTAGPTNITAPAGTCETISRFSPAGSLPTCAWNGRTYNSPNTFSNDPGGNPYRLVAQIPASQSCLTGDFNRNSVNGIMAFQVGNSTTNVPAGLVSASTPIRLSFQSDPPGGLISGTSVRASSPPSGFSGAANSATNRGSPTNLGAPMGAGPHPSYPGGVTCNTGDVIDSSNSTLCAGITPCTLVTVGWHQVAATGCGTEGSSPCFQCRYQPRTFTWQAASKNCTYAAERYDYSVDRTAQQCTFTRPRWATSYDVTTYTCVYNIGARRYDFSAPTTAYCEYFAVQSSVRSPRTLYTYEYLTKGTELIGRGRRSGIPGGLCGTTWDASNAFGTACPETIAGCAGVSPDTAAAAMFMGESTCRLKWGGPNAGNDEVADASRNGRNNGRAFGYRDGTTVPFLTVNENHRACESPASSIAPTPNSYRDAAGSPRGFCSQGGSPALSHRRLISDYFDPDPTTNANSLASFYGSAYPAPWVVDWNNTPRKDQGFSAVMDGGIATGTGALPNRAVFVPIPDDVAYSSAAQRTALRDAMRKCVPPSVSDPGPSGVLDGGVCVADERVRNSSGVITNGETPLYGSLYSTYEYLRRRWDVDGVDEKQCREYFIVLATDGLEATPKGFTLGGSDPSTSVQGLVSSFRNTAVGVKSRPDVKTFVIALGSGAAGSPILNDVAAAGGTTQAFNATSLSELQTALQTVFTSITQGVFSRSRPAIGTDGSRLYAAQFIRPAGVLPDGGFTGPDWSGLLSAFRIDPTNGVFTLAWEHAAKLNNPAHPARTIVAALCEDPGDETCDDDDREVVPFTTGSSLLMDQLDDSPDFPGSITSGDVISFLRNTGESYLGSPGVRTSRLGPISHSAPVVVGRSPYDRTYGGSTPAQQAAFEAFQQTTAADAGRPVRVFVEANDGMLHSIIENTGNVACGSGEADINCPNGREDWALIPGSMDTKFVPSLSSRPDLITQLFRLKEGGWAANYLNNTPSIADVCGDGSGNANNCAANQWKTIAILTMREGGRSLAAFDITNPGVAPNTSRFLWDYAEDDVGLTYSAPAIGRVKDGSNEKFVAVFGGGADDPNTSELDGHRVFILNALTGEKIREFNKFDKGPSEFDLNVGIVARPAIHRRPGTNFAFMSSAFVPAGPTLYALRFAKPNGDLEDEGGKWKPDELFDPTSNRNDDYATCASPPCGLVQVKRVTQLTAGNPVAVPPEPPTYGLVVEQDLPLASAPPILNRPRLAPVLVQNGSTIDLFVGTGDARTPADPATEFRNGNYFYAVHDFNLQPKGSKNDGRALWVVKFPKLGTAPAPEQFEQVVSEPAIISGCVVVATYTTPASSASCNLDGDTTLYGFRPIDGELQPCLTFTAPSPYAGSNTPVIKMPGAGIPSDLVVINDNVYLSTSKDGLTRAPVRVPPRPGAVRSYRRIK